MSDGTTIEWCDASWNPVRGCDKVSPGCKNCYAERFAERWRGVKGHPFEQGFDLRLVPEKIEEPLHWKKPRRIFVNSMSDLFHEDVPDEFILRVFNVMREAHALGHVFQVLTKRAERMADFCRRLRFDAGWLRQRAGGMWLVGGPEVGEVDRRELDRMIPGYGFSMVMRQLWLGVSVENQAAADERIPHLLATPAAVRFVSCEPLLGPVDLRRGSRGPTPADVIRWVIVGGESGPGARPMRLPWAGDIVAQCKAVGVPVFVKQLGAVWAREEKSANKKGGEMERWPPSLRVREFPQHPGESR